MGLSFPLLSSVLMMMVMGPNHAGLEPKMYWEKVLPNTPMPRSIEKLLPYVDVKTASSMDGGVNLGRRGIGVSTGPNSKDKLAAGTHDPNFKDKSAASKYYYYGGTSDPNFKDKSAASKYYYYGGTSDPNFKDKSGASKYYYYGGTSDPNFKEKPATAKSYYYCGIHDLIAKDKPAASKSYFDDGTPNKQLKDTGSDEKFAAMGALFFLRNELRIGKQFILQLSLDDACSATFIPRREAETIPFSTSKLPSILTHYGISPSSDEAVAMRDTLQRCEMEPVEGEAKQCTTSLEAMVDFATAKLDTRDVVVMETEWGGISSAAGLRPYKVKAIRRVADEEALGGKGAAVCHPVSYAHAVFLCHTTPTAEVYSIDLAATDDNSATVKAVAMCHTDTTKWRTDFIAFNVLGVEPGKATVCHFLPLDHVLWAAKPKL